MEDAIGKKLVKDQKTIKPEEGKQDELSEKDLGKAVGGAAVDYFIKIDGVSGES